MEIEMPNTACDESKCVSRGQTELFDGSFTCFGDDDGAQYPRMCADGYRPLVIPNELSVLAKPRTYLGFWDVDEDTDEIDYSEWIPVRYFTCCPPDVQKQQTELSTSVTNAAYANANATRHCSDPIVIDSSEDKESSSENEDDENISEPLVCEDPEQSMPLEMKTAVKKVPSIYLDRTASSGNIVDSYLCCDSQAAGSITNSNSTAIDTTTNSSDSNLSTQAASLDFLETTECVPYCNPYYDECRAKSPYRLRMFNPIVCSDPELGFDVPRPMDNINGTMEDVAESGLYQCCRSGIPLDPYVQDTTFWVETSTFFSVYLVAGVFALVVILGLAIPLVCQLMNGTYQKFQDRTASARSQTGNRSTTNQRTFSTDSIVSTSNDNRRTSANRRTPSSIRKPYSAYNLYLIYLAIPDFLVALYALVKIGSMMAQEIYPFWSPYSIMNAMAAFHTLSNLWLNAIVMYEVLKLLKSSRMARKIEQPSLTRVTLQALVVYVIAASAGVFAYFAYNIPISNGLGKVETIILNQGYTGWFFIFVFLPIGYSVYVSIKVWRGGYLPKSAGTGSRSEKARRELAIYFFRIVAVFVGVWFPSVVFRFVGNYCGLPWLQIITICGPAIQAIATSALVLTKSDARKYIMDLLTLRYIRQYATCGRVSSDVDASDSYRDSTGIGKMSNSKNYLGSLNESTGPTAYESHPMNDITTSAKNMSDGGAADSAGSNSNDVEACVNGDDVEEDQNDCSGRTVSTRRESPMLANMRSSVEVWASRCQEEQSTTGASTLFESMPGEEC